MCFFALSQVFQSCQWPTPFSGTTRNGSMVLCSSSTRLGFQVLSCAHCPCSIFHIWIECTEGAVILHSDYCYCWHKGKKVYCVWWISIVLWRGIEIVELPAFSRYMLGNTQLPVNLLWNKKVTSKNSYRHGTFLAPFGETLMKILRLNWCASSSSPFYI